MNRIHDFIAQGIKSFFSVYPNDEIAECCNKLNDYLNPIEIVEYEDFLCQNERLVDKEIEKLFSNIFEEMYIYLPDCFGMLKNYQECEYIEGEKYRDHYYHSIQCFLLALSLFSRYKDVCHQEINNKNVVGKLFTITMYHDLGYLYKTKYANISDSLKRRFDSLSLNDDIGIQEICKMLRLKDITNKDLKSIVNGEEISSLWSDSINGNDRIILQNKLNLAKLCSNYAKHHSYESAVLLDRLLRSKQLIINNLQSRQLKDDSIDINTSLVQSEIELDFIDSMKSIIMHDYNLTTPISFSDSYWGCFLMIVDELQDYGRPYQDTKNNINIINPYHIGLEFDNNKIKFDVDNVLEDKKLQFYKKRFSKTRLYKALEEKIKEEELNKIFL